MGFINLVHLYIIVTTNTFILGSGNELSGSGIGAKVSATQYAADVIELSKILKDIYKHSLEKPLTVAPDGFFDLTWFQKLLQQTGPNVLNAVTRHIYNLGAGR